MFNLTLLHHSGFALRVGQTVSIFDYWTDPSSALSPLLHDAHEVLAFVSHFHKDHWNPEILNLFPKGSQFFIDKNCRPGLRRQIGSEALSEAESSGLLTFVRKGDVIPIKPDGNFQKVHCFGSTDSGVSFLLESKQGLIFHAGDLNDWDWDDEDSPQMQANFRRILGDISLSLKTLDQPIRLALFPCDQRLGNLALKGALDFLKHLPTQFITPMHLSGGLTLPAELQEQINEQGLSTRVLPLIEDGASLPQLPTCI